jgi:hypothetical protein
VSPGDRTTGKRRPFTRPAFSSRDVRGCPAIWLKHTLGGEIGEARTREVCSYHGRGPGACPPLQCRRLRRPLSRLGHSVTGSESHSWGRGGPTPGALRRPRSAGAGLAYSITTSNTARAQATDAASAAPTPGRQAMPRPRRSGRAGMGRVSHKPCLSGPVRPAPRTPALINRGACPTSPVYRGLCAPRPERALIDRGACPTSPIYGVSTGACGSQAPNARVAGEGSLRGRAPSAASGRVRLFHGAHAIGGRMRRVGAVNRAVR